MRPWDKSEYTEYNDLMRKAKKLELESQLKELKAIQLDNLKRVNQIIRETNLIMLS